MKDNTIWYMFYTIMAILVTNNLFTYGFLVLGLIFFILSFFEKDK